MAIIALVISVGVKLVMSNHTYKVGDRYYLQLEGGAIGLELTGAVSRPFMMRWDRMYLKKVKSAGIKMRMYDRYVDDSNQAAEVLPPGSKYDKNVNKVVIDEQELLSRMDEGDEPRLARILKEVANEVQEGIIIEEDYPTKNPNEKLAILDMYVWLNSEHYIVYQHYEKPTASKLVIGAQSAQSESCKRSVHTREMIRRMLNTSNRLDWTTFAVPVLNEYMARMMAAGYKQTYRKNILQKSVAIYDRMIKDDEEGIIPINRPKSWRPEERHREKQRKKHTWSTKGGYIAPIMVPPTPNSELLNMMREVAEKESDDGLRFKIIETGGRTVKREVQQSNPTATHGCTSCDCLACKDGRGKGGGCRRSNALYQVQCKQCPTESPSVYIGETARNLYSRAREHKKNYDSGKGESFMVRH